MEREVWNGMEREVECSYSMGMGIPSPYIQGIPSQCPHKATVYINKINITLILASSTPILAPSLASPTLVLPSPLALAPLLPLALPCPAPPLAALSGYP